MKNKFVFCIVLVFVLSVFLFLTKTVFAFKAKTVDYMPRNQELITTEKPDTTQAAGYPYTLNESSCAAGFETLNAQVSRCAQCMQLKALCPDCCISTVPSRKTQCEDLLSISTAHPPIFNPITGDKDPRKACSTVSSCLNNLPSNTSPGTTDRSYSAYKTYCINGSSIPGCAVLGCPNSDGAPKQSGGVQCQLSSTTPGAFICDTYDIDELAVAGCEPTQASGVNDCTKLQRNPVNRGSTGSCGGGGGRACSINDNGLYIMTEMDDASCPTGYTHCWEYKLTNGVNSDRNLSGCISACQAAANLQEQSAKNLDCCNRDSSVCCNDALCMYGINDTGTAPRKRPGYQNNCNDDACTGRPLTEDDRIHWKECQPGKNTVPSFCCDDLTPADCINYTTALDKLLGGMTSGGAFGCFGDISKAGDELVYDFVAKSNEKLMVIWQATLSPEYFYCGSSSACTADQENAAAALPTLPSTGTEPNTYFYTIVKIFDLTADGAEVYPGTNADTVMNQRSFVSTFSVFAAIATGNQKADPTKSIFQQGHKYRVKLYYLMAPLDNYVLRSKVSQTQLIVMRLRE